MTTTDYRFHTDPGHGWLEVSRAELVRLGLESRISIYSYQRGNTIYLEEDCDASLFLARKKELGESISFTDVNHRNNDAPCRRYSVYSQLG